MTLSRRRQAVTLGFLYDRVRQVRKENPGVASRSSIANLVVDTFDETELVEIAKLLIPKAVQEVDEQERSRDDREVVTWPTGPDRRPHVPVRSVGRVAPRLTPGPGRYERFTLTFYNTLWVEIRGKQKALGDLTAADLRESARQHRMAAADEDIQADEEEALAEELDKTRNAKKVKDLPKDMVKEKLTVSIKLRKEKGEKIDESK